MAAPASVASIKKHFRGLKDPRVKGRSWHLLIDIVTMAICGVIGNCDDWQDIALFAKQRESWFRRFLKLPNGIPSHHTFERVFARLDARSFSCCCVDWLRAASDLVGLSHIAIDGKSLCGSASSQLGPLHLVSAWATRALEFGTGRRGGQRNEITDSAALEMLDLRGAWSRSMPSDARKQLRQVIEKKGITFWR